jgi:23S rRNA pseudouridine955/2504/2580 synthase
MQELVVPNKYDNKKINTFLLDSFDGLTQNTLFKTLRKKDIKVNNTRINSNITIHTNDNIKIYVVDNLLFSNNTLEIIYEDLNLLILNKPNGIEVTGQSSLTSQVQKKYPQALPCHRLDRNTTGLIVFAKNKESLDILFDKFKNHEITKYYKATVYGIPENKHQILYAYLFKDKVKSQVYISNTPKKGYRKIITEYSVISTNKIANTSILEIILHTGRTHQIRAHLAYIGFPIIGDGKYGKNEINKKFKKSSQELSSYKIIFNFKTDAGILNYLNGKIFSL